MACCGRGRPQPERQGTRLAPPAAVGLAPPVPRPVGFAYTGATQLVAQGAFTRRRYRFDEPGAVVDVDARDAPSFAAIPQLRRVIRT